MYGRLDDKSLLSLIMTGASGKETRAVANRANRELANRMIRSGMKPGFITELGKLNRSIHEACILALKQQRLFAHAQEITDKWYS